MRIVNSGGMYKIYGNDLKVTDRLPIGSYRVGFNKDNGFFLTEFPESVITDSKIYGVHESKVNKVLKAFEATNRNLGLILLGDKGMGKSLFSKLLTKKVLNRNMPTIMVEQYIPGIANFLGSIDDEVMIMFDEFEKVFRKEEKNSHDPQEELLTLFDGLYNGKKLFCITCNNMWGLNDYLKNRTGRFHYLFTFEYPNADEVREYLKDHINECNYDKIEDVVSFSMRAPVSYDSLRSIAFEINLSNESFAEIIKDMNICLLADFNYDITIHYNDTIATFKRDLDMLQETIVIDIPINGFRGVVKADAKDLRNVDGTWVIENPIYEPYDNGREDRINVTKVEMVQRKENSFRYKI
jgi:hypothetical protein